MKIGVLLPASRLFPGVDRSFLAGLRGALAEAGIPHELIPEPAGNCAVKDSVLDHARRLLLQHAPAAVTGVIGAGVSRHLLPLFEEAQTPLLLNDLGADPFMTCGESRSHVFSNSLNLWQSLYALGFWASRNVGRRACVAAGFHEAGYGIIQAFWLGFQQHGGGTVLSTEVTHRNSSSDDPSDALRRSAGAHPDFVMAFYSGREGVSFLEAWDRLGLRTRLPLLGTPLITHGHWLPAIGDRAAGMRTALSWDTSALPDAHERFRRACQTEMPQPAVFALLGYETGRILGAAVERSPDASAGGTALRDALPGLRFASPRGELRIDADTGEVGSIDYLQEVRRAEDGAWSAVALQKLSLPASFSIDYDAVRASDTRAGWLNPYLVT